MIYFLIIWALLLLGAYGHMFYDINQEGLKRLGKAFTEEE